MRPPPSGSCRPTGCSRCSASRLARIAERISWVAENSCNADWDGTNGRQGRCDVFNSARDYINGVGGMIVHDAQHEDARVSPPIQPVAQGEAARSRRTSARLSETINLNTRYGKPIPRIMPRDVSIIIPVKNNQKGRGLFPRSILCHPRPRAMAERDSDRRQQLVCLRQGEGYLSAARTPHSPACLYAQGPAAARNCGVQASLGEWLLFSDRDCNPTASLLTGYLNSTKQAIAFAGHVKGTPTAYLSKYYDDE